MRVDDSCAGLLRLLQIWSRVGLPGFSLSRLRRSCSKSPRPHKFRSIKGPSNDNIAISHPSFFDTFQRLIKSFTMPSGQGHRCKQTSFRFSLLLQQMRISLFVPLYGLMMEWFADTVYSIRSRVCSVLYSEIPPFSCFPSSLRAYLLIYSPFTPILHCDILISLQSSESHICHVELREDTANIWNSRHISYQRAKRNTNPNTSLIQIEGVGSTEAAR